MGRPTKDPSERRVRRDYRFSPQTLEVLKQQGKRETTFIENAILKAAKKEKDMVVTLDQISLGGVQFEPEQALEILQTLYANRDLLLKRALGVSPFSKLRLECPSCHSQQLIEVDTESDGYYLGCPSCGSETYLNFRGEFIEKDEE